MFQGGVGGPLEQAGLGTLGFTKLGLQLLVHLLEDTRHSHEPGWTDSSEGVEERSLESIFVSEMNCSAATGYQPNIGNLRI